IVCSPRMERRPMARVVREVRLGNPGCAVVLQRTRNRNGARGIRTPKPFRAPVFKTGAIAILPALPDRKITNPPTQDNRTTLSAPLTRAILHGSSLSAVVPRSWHAHHTSFALDERDHRRGPHVSRIARRRSGHRPRRPVVLRRAALALDRPTAIR